MTNWEIDFFGDFVLDITAEHEARVGVDARQGGEEKADDGKEEKFKGLENDFEDGDVFGAGRAISGVNEENNQHGKEGDGEDAGADLGQGFAESSAGKNGV